jgi:hypothetical protein
MTAPPGNTGYEQNPRSYPSGTVPTGAPKNANPNVPQQISTGTYGDASAVPSKPSATTGPGGPSISIPKVGKPGK